MIKMRWSPVQVAVGPAALAVPLVDTANRYYTLDASLYFLIHYASEGTGVLEKMLRELE